ncbi:DMT family transporter [Geodermatophilus sp. SYSU D00803]
MSRPRAWAALILAAGCFGFDTTLSSYVLRHLRVADLFLLETTVGAVAVWALLLATQGFRRPRSIRRLALLGLVEPGAVFLLFNLGLTRTSAVSAGLLAATDTLIAVVAAVAVLHERLPARGWVALAGGTAGTALVSLGPGGGEASLTGNLLVLAGSAVGASYFLIGRRLPADDTTLSGTACQLLAGCGMAVTYTAVSWPTQGSALPSAPAGLVLAAVAAGIVGTAIPFYLLNRALETTSASTAALVLNLVPVFAVATAVLLLGESLRLPMLLGGGLILAGLVVLARSEAGQPGNDQPPQEVTETSPHTSVPCPAEAPAPFC